MYMCVSVSLWVGGNGRQYFLSCSRDSRIIHCARVMHHASCRLAASEEGAAAGWGEEERAVEQEKALAYEVRLMLDRCLLKTEPPIVSMH